MNVTKPILITILIGVFLVGIALASAFMGPNIKQLRKERKELFEQLDAQLEENEKLREDILKEREGWIRYIDTLEQTIIFMDESITNKNEALVENSNKNDEALDSLTTLPDSLHKQFLTDQFGIKFD